MKTIVFVDGYNLYYGMLRRSKLKWLDLYKLFSEHVLAHGTELLEVRYYTSPVLGRMCDNPESPQRQRLYLQALRSEFTGKVVIVEGKMVSS
ncbi:MAG: 6-hydroxy-3-succinoylpyridine hydroxylase, partial [Burkholderiaceae bacterium]|nr:6-hydroxy-3-succinoylpyridine hydroxylase [Burkholderiaceae bacterium]